MDDVLRVSGGLVSGGKSPDGRIRSFLGIPYAAPPVGELRWRPPAPVRPWSGVRRADHPGPIAMQAAGSAADETMAEDCLCLNVWTGAETAEDRLPVMLWIHGGGFIEGSGSKPDYNGEALSRKGIVVVTINYRLNIFGFLAHPELSRESRRGVSGNYGLLDAIAALDWVRANITTFGGDPEKITIAGESAGSMAVSALTCSPLAAPHLAGAIAESLVYSEAPRLDEMEAIGAEFGRKAGVPSLAALRSLPAEELLAASRQHGAGLVHRPLVDDWVLSGDIFSAQLPAGRRRVPVLTGFNADEASWMERVGAEKFIRDSRRFYAELADEFQRLYPADSDPEADDSYRAAVQDRIVWGHVNWAGQLAARAQPAYVYCFTRVPPLGGEGGARPRPLGAYHSAEVPYAFDNLSQVSHPWQPADHELAGVMSSYWANFVKRGDPNGEGLPAWPAFGQPKKRLMELGDRVKPLNLGLAKRKMDFWAAEHAYARKDPESRWQYFTRF